MERRVGVGVGLYETEKKGIKRKIMKQLVKIQEIEGEGLEGLLGQPSSFSPRPPRRPIR